MIINIILNDAFISNYIYCMEIYAEKYFILLLDFFYLDIYPRNDLNIYLVQINRNLLELKLNGIN